MPPTFLPSHTYDSVLRSRPFNNQVPSTSVWESELKKRLETQTNALKSDYESHGTLSNHRLPSETSIDWTHAEMVSNDTRGYVFEMTMLEKDSEFECDLIEDIARFQSKGRSDVLS